ncbi:trafficking protein particle complex subunit 10 [Cimex lectularius]|uniref:Trafficking protein particle complex subunit 10 n=1 Tax=Cimex lectularius TaxID=79782 RepID=A0A8I6TJ97_CIMLE|nr:trafficking protein particle complex subunit 10 [Cimex lectularius]
MNRPESLVNGSSGNAEMPIAGRKPIVTYAGDKELFMSLENTLSTALPNEPAEWRRSYGRAIKLVNVSATFVPFTKHVLPKEGDYRLIDQPMFHTYWTQCSDVDIYKSTVREEIEKWMKDLSQYNLMDWMIVVVEAYDFRKTNKLLPRATVYDKVKSDYGAKHADRCLSVINPLKSESRSAGSWRGLIVNMRLLLLTAYDRALLKFEEIIRDQREKRNQVGWSFTKYFLLQEELAFVLEMLGVYEEALVQYDELDALFTQFILNSSLGETPNWLGQFQSTLDSWDGVRMSSGINMKERSRIENDSISLLQFRNYLFSRQCAMLICVRKPSEIAERTLPFLHNTIREMSMLDVSYTQGAIACWVYLSCMEVLEACGRFSEPNLIEKYSKFTAGILSYAREKLAELGELCGLLPKQVQTSEQLHISVQIFSGLSDDFTKPVEKLKKALSSQEEFSIQYLGISELAMGTYKHIGRVRCARSLGFDLAKYYWCKKEYNSSIVYLRTALDCYENDGWKQLAANTRLLLAKSYYLVENFRKYTQMCLYIACTQEIELKDRLKHYEDMLKTLSSSKPDPPWTANMNDCMSFTVGEIQVDQRTSTVSVPVTVKSNFPCDINCTSISLAVMPYLSSTNVNSYRNSPEISRKIRKTRDPSQASVLQKIPLFVHLVYKQDRNLSSANIDVRDPNMLLLNLRRQESVNVKHRKLKFDFTRSLSAKDVQIKPGENKITLQSKSYEAGNYKLGPFKVILGNSFELTTLPLNYKTHFEVTKILPSIKLTHNGDLLAGLEQTAILNVASNGYRISEGSVLSLSATDGLLLQESGTTAALSSQVDIQLPEVFPNSTLKIPLSLYAELPTFRGTNTIEHSIIIRAPWTEDEWTIPLILQPALSANLRLHTAKMDKFLLVNVSGLSAQVLRVHNPSLVILRPHGIALSPFNPPIVPTLLNDERKISYIWKIEPSELKEIAYVKTEFSLYYEPVESDSKSPFLYKCTFDINNFLTMYIVDCKVDPIRGSEFCRVNTVCHLLIKISKTHMGQDTSLMYEVQAENNMWVVCGNSSDVLSWSDSVEERTVTLEIMPLVNGYLPLPVVKLSKYILTNPKFHYGPNTSPRGEFNRRLEPFSCGQIYNVSKGAQVHVIAAATPQDM